MKKKFTIVLCSLFTALSSFAQSDYRPLVEQGKKWTFQNNTYQNVYDYYYTLEGDTVVAGKNCQKMYSENKDNTGAVVYEGALYEENKKVYCFYPEKDETTLLYDFDCEAGDTKKSMVVKEIRTDTIATVVKRYIFEPYLMSDNGEEFYVLLGNVSWIESVGSEKDFFDMLPMAGNYNSLVACEVNGEFLFKLPPLPSSVIKPVERNFVNVNTVYDLQGRRSSNPHKGINVIRQSNGTTRKVVVK